MDPSQNSPHDTVDQDGAPSCSGGTMRGWIARIFAWATEKHKRKSRSYAAQAVQCLEVRQVLSPVVPAVDMTSAGVSASVLFENQATSGPQSVDPAMPVKDHGTTPVLNVLLDSVPVLTMSNSGTSSIRVYSVNGSTFNKPATSNLQGTILPRDVVSAGNVSADASLRVTPSSPLAVFSQDVKAFPLSSKIESLESASRQRLAELRANSDHSSSASSIAISVPQNHERQFGHATAIDVARSENELNRPNRVTSSGQLNAQSVSDSAAICDSGVAALLESGENADFHARTLGQGAGSIALAISNAESNSIVRNFAIPGADQTATVQHTPSTTMMDWAFGGNTFFDGDHISVVNRLKPEWIVTPPVAAATTATSELSNAENPAGNQPDRRQWSRQMRVLRAAQHDPIVFSPNMANLMLPVVAGVSCFLANIWARGPPRGPPRSQLVDAGRGRSRSCSSQLNRLRFSISPRGPSLIVRFAKPVTLSASGPGRTFRTSELCCSNTC